MLKWMTGVAAAALTDDEGLISRIAWWVWVAAMAAGMVVAVLAPHDQ
jgi:hypothetical protein